MHQKSLRLRQTSKTNKIRSISTNHDNLPCRDIKCITDKNSDINKKQYRFNQSMYQMISRIDSQLVIKKEFLQSHWSLTVLFKLTPQTYQQDRNKQQKQSFSDFIELNLKSHELTITKNKIKHIHTIAKDFNHQFILINFSKRNQLINIQCENLRTLKKHDISLQKISKDKNEFKNFQFYQLSPLQILREGEKLRACKIQGDKFKNKKKIAWGQNQTQKIQKKSQLSSLGFTSSAHSKVDCPKINQNLESCSKKLNFQQTVSSKQDLQIFKIQQKIFSHVQSKIFGMDNKNLVLQQSNFDKNSIKLRWMQDFGKIKQKQSIKVKNNYQTWDIKKQLLQQKKRSITYKSNLQDLHKLSQSTQIGCKKNKQNAFQILLSNKNIQQKQKNCKKQTHIKKSKLNSSKVSMIKSVKVKTQAY